MDSTHPAFVSGFVKQCRALGLDEDATVAAFATHDLQANLNDPDFARGFRKAAAGGNLLAAIKELGGKAKGAWDGASTATKGTIVGGVAGGAAGLLSKKNKIRNALLGALLGGGAGNLLGRNAVPGLPPPAEPFGKARQFAMETDPVRWNEALKKDSLPSPQDTLVDRMNRRRVAGKDMFQAGDPELKATSTSGYWDPVMANMGQVGAGLKEMATPSPVRSPLLWRLK